MNIHLHNGTDENLVARVIKKLIEGGSIKNTYLAVDSSLITLASSLYPEIRICNMKFQQEPEKYIEETKKWNCERLQFFSPSYEVTRKMVEKVHLAKIKVNVFYANATEVAEKYFNKCLHNFFGLMLLK
ncbi:MAG: hypothetical protein NC911_02645 [Candidatus Omnitrophica bacterium]|nr:hypothetical protein [Candidatus Omnitrophota bacterium]